jgi:hypothetical protein
LKIDNAFLNRTPIAQKITEKWGCIKYKLLHNKGKNYWNQKKIYRREKISASYLSDKGFIFRIYKDLQRLNTKRIIHLISR